MSSERWSSRLAFYLGAAGAAVGLGSIWRFPYLAGTSGGGVFIVAFVLACLLIATPLLAAEFALGRRSRKSPPQAAGEVAVQAGLSRGWDVIGILGTVSAFLIVSYYMVIAGWVMAYTWKCATGVLAAAGPERVQALWPEFVSSSYEVAGWHAAFVVLAAFISSRGLNKGIEIANKIRGPGLLILLCILVAYALATGDVQQAFAFAFQVDFSRLTAQVLLDAVGQAFYATGVGMAMMIAYGAYVDRGTSLVRTSLVISGSILLVSLLATLMIFPLVFAYGVDPAQGRTLVFQVLPRVFTEMPAGRLIGTLFFLLLVLAALMPSIASLEATTAWLAQRFGISRSRAVYLSAGAAWFVGLGSVASFSAWSKFFPLGFLPYFANQTVYDVSDSVPSNLLLPAGAFLTSLLMGWRLSKAFAEEELAETTPLARRAVVWLLRYLCPLAIAAVFIAAVS